MKKNILLLSVLGLSGLIQAQISAIDFRENNDLHRAKFLYSQQTYLASQHAFESYLQKENISAEEEEISAYYAALTSLINNQSGGESQLLSFQAKYPHSNLINQGNWQLGSYYLSKGDFDKAYDYLSRGDLEELSPYQKEEYQFKLGYINFMKNKKDKALSFLTPLVNHPTYGEKSSYYVGHIYYENRQYDKAQPLFDKLLKNNPEYRKKLLPYIVQIQFNDNNYDKAILLGKELLETNHEPHIKSEISKIIGESYFRQEKYNESLPYLEAYSGEMSASDYYQLGYVYYQKKDYEKAISLFNKIVSRKDAMAQIAYYQLGNSYLQTSRKKQALSAFESASKMNFNPNLKEDAFYQYAKLSYDMGNPYESTPIILQKYLNDFPNGLHRGEIQDLLIDAYLTSGDYHQAVAMLGQISHRNMEQNKSYQLANFLYATKIYKNGDLKNAKTYFKSATENNFDKTVTSRANFWLGELAYREAKYHEALTIFNKLESFNSDFPEKKELKYQLGYTHYKLKNFPLSEKYFKEYLASNPAGNFKADAKMRLADSYIGNSNNSEAISIYEELENSNNLLADEAAYNKAVAIGLTQGAQAKAKALESFVKNYPISKFSEQAQLELADTYIDLNKNNHANLVLDNLTQHPNPTFASEAYLRKGLIAYNQKNKNEALNYFVLVTEKSPNTPQAIQAIENAKRIYLDNNDYRGFEKWASKFSYYQVNSDEIQTLVIDNALKSYDAKDYNEAIKAFENLLKDYPSLSENNQINYSLGESYYQTNQWNKALRFLNSAAATGSYKADALLRLSQIYLNQNKQTEAKLSLENLYRNTLNSAYINFAEKHLMKIYSDENNPKAIEMAHKVLDNSKNEDSVIEDARLILARNLFLNGKSKEAEKAYIELEKASSSSVRAEALYYKALLLNQRKDFETSNQVIFDLASKYSEQQKWGSQALVLMADNYYKQGDLYQANYTLESVLSNYKDFPEVIKKAKALQQKIKSRKK